MTMIHSIKRRNVRQRASMSAAAAAAVLLIAGCGGGAASAPDPDAPAGAGAGPTASGAQAPAGAVLEVTGKEFSFAPAPLKAAAGKTTIRFTNSGIMEHDLSIDALKVKIKAAAGKTGEAVVILKPGTYKTTCSVPGHIQSGMVGTLKVS
jgi:plastocyanin